MYLHFGMQQRQEIVPAVPLTSVRQPSERILKIKQQQQSPHDAPSVTKTMTPVKFPYTRSRTLAVLSNVSAVENENDPPRPSTRDAPPLVSVQLPEKDNV